MLILSIPCAYNILAFHHNIPFLANERFVDREKELSKLESLLFSEDSCSNVAIHGLGGVGKTQIALALAHKAYSECHGYAVFWIQATTIESIQKSYTEIAGELQLLGLDNENADVKTLLKDYLNKRTGKWLLIFDNADDGAMWLAEPPADPRPKSYPLTQFLPESKYGRVLFTTRDKAIACDVAPNPVEVGELSEEQAKTLLKSHLESLPSNQDNLAQSDRSLQEDKDILLLLRQLACLPLAIAQAASFMKKNSMGVSRYLKLLDRPEQEVIDLLSKNFKTDGRYPGLKNPVITTWLVSFEYICKEPLSLKYLCFAACIEPKDIPESLLPSTESEVAKYDAIGTLLAYSFMTWNATNDSLSMHRLVHIATRNWLRKQTPPSELSLSKSFSSALTTLGDKFPRGHYADRQKWREYMPHALSLLQAHESQELPERYQLLYQVSNCLRKDGRYKQAVGFLEQLVKWVRDTQDPNDSSNLASQNLLAIVYRSDGQLKPALELLEHLAEVQEKLYTERFSSRVTSQNETTSRHELNTPVTPISKMMDYVVAMVEKARAETDPYRLAFQHSLAIVHHANGNTSRAVEILEHIVEVEKAIYPTESDPELLTSQHSLARLWGSNGQTDQALELLTHVLEVRKKTLNEDDPSRMSSQIQLANIYKKIGKIDQALKLLEPLVEFAEETLAEDDSMRLASQCALASVYKAGPEPKRALGLLEHIVTVKTKALPEDNLSLLAAQHSLANALKELHQTERALEIQEHVVMIKKKALAEDHPSLLLSQHQFAMICIQDENITRAIDLLRHVVRIKEKTLPEEHPALLTSQHVLAATYYEDGQELPAKQLMHHVVAVRRRVLPEDDPNRMESERVLAKFDRRDKEKGGLAGGSPLQTTVYMGCETS